MAKDKLAPRKRHEWTHKKKADFCDALASGVTVRTAAEAMGMSRSGAYKQRESDPDFAEGWGEAKEEGKERLEAECRRRAMGWTETRCDKDGNAFEVFRYSDNLLMFMLKKLDPTYREHMGITIETRRRIIVDLVQVVKDEATGRLMLADDRQPPLLTAGERNDGQDD